MRQKRSWILIGLIAGFGLLAVGGGYRALAQQPAAPAKRTVEQRVAELENKVKFLELKLRTVESTLERTPRLGPQAVQQR